MATPPATSNPSAGHTDAAHHDAMFCKHMTTVAQQMHARFPDKQEVATLVGQLPMLDMVPQMKHMLRSGWRDFTKDYREDIMHRRLEPVTKMFETTDVAQAKMIGVHEVLADPSVEPETKESLWRYLQLLTIISHADAPTAITTEPEPDQRPTPIAPPQSFTAQAPPAAPGATGATPAAPAAEQKFDLEKVIKTVLDSAPKAIETFNKVMEDDSEKNVIGQLFRQFANPGGTHPGMAGNLAAHVIDEKFGGASVMETVQEELGDLSPDEIVKRLQEYESLKKLAKANKKRRRPQGSDGGDDV